MTFQEIYRLASLFTFRHSKNSSDRGETAPPKGHWCTNIDVKKYSRSSRRFIDH